MSAQQAAIDEGRTVEVCDDRGNDYAMTYEIDRDEAGPYPFMLRFRYLGLPWQQREVPQRIQDRLIAAAYARIQGDLS